MIISIDILILASIENEELEFHNDDMIDEFCLVFDFLRSLFSLLFILLTPIKWANLFACFHENWQFRQKL